MLFVHGELLPEWKWVLCTVICWISWRELGIQGSIDPMSTVDASNVQFIEKNTIRQAHPEAMQLKKLFCNLQSQPD